MAEDLVIRIGAESEEFLKELDKITNETEGLESKLGTLAKVSGVAFGVLVAEAGLAVHAYAEQEQAVNKLNQSLQTQGIFSQDLSDKYRKIASDLQDLTGANDDAIIRGQALLQSFLGQTVQTEELNKAVLDLSVGAGIDLEQAFSLVGKTIGSNINALGRYGLQINSNATEQEKLAAVLDFVNTKYKGQAEAQAQGLGSVKLLSAAFEDFQKKIGEQLAPTLTVIIQGITKLFKEMADNKPLFDLILGAGIAAGVITGLITAASVAALTFAKLRAAFVVVNALLPEMTLGIRSLVGATGIGLLIVLASDLVLNWKERLQQFQALFITLSNNIMPLLSGLGTFLKGVFTLNIDDIKAGLNQTKEAFQKGFKEFEEIRAKQAEGPKKVEQDPTLKALADANAQKKLLRQQDIENEKNSGKEDLAAKKAREAELRAMRQEEREKLKAEKAAQREEEKKEETLAAENKRIAENEEALITRQNRRDIVELSLLDNEEFNALDADQQAVFLEENTNRIFESLQNENSARRDAALKRSQDQARSNAQFLSDQQKFGKDYALINKLMHNEIYVGSRQAFGELAQLTQSSNSTLKSIGKVAAVANIIIKTAESAMNIYAGFSTIPIIGPALGVAGAAAAVAFGAEQVGRVTAAQDGGIITGGIAGRDSVPSLLTPGELVVPTKNFSEVVNAVAAQRSQDTTGGTFGVNGAVGVAISFEGQEAEKVITARQVEARALGTYRSRV